MALLDKPFMSGANYYLHYNYMNSQHQMLIENYYGLKQSLLGAQLAEFAQRVVTKAKNSGDTEEALHIMDALMSADGKNTLEKILSPELSGESKATTSAAAEAMEGLSFGQINAQQTFRTATNLVEKIASFQKGLEGVLDLIARELGETNFKALQDSVLLELQQKNPNMDSSALKNHILQQIYKHDDKFLMVESSSTTKLNKALKKLLAVAYALSDADGARGQLSKSAKISDSEVMQVIAGKVAGWLNHSTGVMEEIAVAKCLNNADQLAIDRLLKINSSMSGTAGIGSNAVQIDSDPSLRAYMDRINQSESLSKVQKDDVTLQITTDKVTLDIGFSVKKYKVKDNSMMTMVSINKGTPVLAALGYGGLIGKPAFMHALLNAAGGHAGLKNAAGQSISKEALDRRWSLAIEIIGTCAFLYNLAGSGVDRDNSMFFVINRHVYSVPDLIEYVMSNGDAIYTSHYALARDHFVALNKWVGKRGAKDRDEAMQRSTLAATAILSRLYNTKMNAGIRFVSGSIKM